MDSKRTEIRSLIDSEHGKGYSKNVNLSGYTFYRKESFITFRFLKIKGKNIAVIEYIYVTSKTDLIKLLSTAINFFVGKDVQYIYYVEHKRDANYVEKYFPLLDFSVSDFVKTNWKYRWKSDNGFKESEAVEVYL